METNENLTLQTIIQELEKHSQTLRDLQVRRIGIFGSYAKQNQTQESDIDFLVEFETPSFSYFLQLSELLENLFGKKIDLITLAGFHNIRVPEVKERIEKDIVYVPTK